MNNRNTEAIISLAKGKTKEKENIVMNEIKKMVKKNAKISIYSVSKVTGVSRSFLYNNKLLFDKINEYRHGKNEDRKSKESSKVIFKSLQMKCKQLEKENKNLIGNNYKEKYFELLSENKELKNQLQKAYSY